MRLVLCAVLAACAFTPVLAAEEEDPPSPYQREPSGADFQAVWPKAAQAGRFTGQVELACTPGDSGTFVACKVASEKPAGLGFGQAALKLAPKYALKSGTPNDGRLVVQFGDPEYDTYPDWKRRPSALELMAVYPNGVIERGGAGKATMSCEIAANGALRDCKVVSEDPPGQGWGLAALALAPQFLMHPPTKDGKPVAGGTVRIPINWARYTPSQTSTSRKLLTSAVWSRAPSHADVVAAYPRKAREARAGGDVTLRCRLKSDGRLHACETALERPKGLGLAAGARELVRHFVGPTTAGQNESTAGAGVDIRFTFDPKVLTDATPVVGKPDWAKLPSGEDLKWPDAALMAGQPDGRAVLTCTVADGGLMQACKVASESPPGVGYGEAALKLSSKFVLNTWSDEGLPVIGGQVNIPVRYRMTEPAPAAPDARN